MEVSFTSEQEVQLARLAALRGTASERLVRDAALRMIEEDAHFRAVVRAGIAQADRGEFIGEQEMNLRFEKLMRS